jgi:iron complex transport system permease protein
MTKAKQISVYASLSLLLIIVLATVFGAFNLLADGNTALSFEQKLKIVLDLRLPRILTCILIGAILSVCGLLMQTLLNNPLACPYTLGVSQLVALLLFALIFWGIQAAFIFIIGLILLLSVFLAITKKTQISLNDSKSNLILLGLGLGSFCSSILLALQFSLDGMSILQLTRWLMGSLAVSGYSGLLPLTLVSALLFASVILFHKDLDSLLLGKELAISRGLNPLRVNTILHIVMFIAVAAVVWSAGPIGFVGLIVPHSIRLLKVIGHAGQAILSAICGAAFLCACDLISRFVLAPAEIPIGVITGLLGTPIFLLLLLIYGRSTKKFANKN